MSDDVIQFRLIWCHFALDAFEHLVLLHLLVLKLFDLALEFDKFVRQHDLVVLVFFIEDHELLNDFTVGRLKHFLDCQ